MKILVFCPNWIGDAVMATPALRAPRETFPRARLELFTTPRDEEAADTVWQRCRLAEFPEVVCLNPGAAFGAAKHWPAESFATLAQELADRRGSGVLVLCGPGERELARKITTLA